MNIFFLFDSTYPYYTGGIETWVYNVCERLVDRHNVTVITVENFRSDNYSGKFENINPKVRIIPVRNLNHVPIIRHFIHKHVAIFSSLVTIKCMVKRLINLLDCSKKNYLIALGTVFMPRVAIRVKKKCPNVVTVASCRGTEPETLGEEYPGVGPFVQKLQKDNLNKVDQIWANGKDTEKMLYKKGFDAQIIKNGVDYNKLDSVPEYNYRKMGLEDKIVIGTIGSVSKIKGYYQIIEAVAILESKYKLKVHFVGIGKVNARNKTKFEKYAEKAGVKEQVHLIGEHRNVVSFAKGADVMVCASGGGGYGMSILESMVSKTPIVAWNNEVHKQLITNNKTGILVEAWNSEELADGIYRILIDPLKARKMGERARKIAKKFDWSIVVDEIESALMQGDKGK